MASTGVIIGIIVSGMISGASGFACVYYYALGRHQPSPSTGSAADVGELELKDDDPKTEMVPDVATNIEPVHAPHRVTAPMQAPPRRYANELGRGGADSTGVFCGVTCFANRREAACGECSCYSVES